MSGLSTPKDRAAEIGEVVERLRELAEKATPGPWKVYGSATEKLICIWRKNVDDVVHWAGFDGTHGSWPKRERDANFMAAANPKTILALLAHLSSQEAEIKRLNSWADSFSDAQLTERATGEAYQQELRDLLRTKDEEIEKLKERLEVTHAWRLVDGELIKVPVPDGFPDGIECRDETIKMLQDNYSSAARRAIAAESRLASQALAVERLREACRPFVEFARLTWKQGDDIFGGITSDKGSVKIRYSDLRALSLALSEVEGGSSSGASGSGVEDDADRCIACDIAFVDGDPYYPDVSGGSLHAACCGPERECYVNLDTGEPIGPEEPIPEPSIWRKL